MNKFTQKAFLQFFYPSTLVGLGIAASNVIDSVVVGQKLGEAGLAAIGYSIPIFMFIDTIYVALSIGSSVKFSQLLGNNETKAADKLASSIFEASFIVGLILALLGLLFTPEIVRCLGASPQSTEIFDLTISYCKILFMTIPFFFLNSSMYYLIRSDNQEVFAGLAFFLGTFTDVVLNFVLVNSLNLGIIGSAYATLCGQVVSIILLFLHLLHKNRTISFKPVPLKLKDSIESFKIGFSRSNQYIARFIFILLVNHVVVRLAGASGVAVFNVVLNCSYIAVIFITAATDSLIPLISTLYGERNYPEQRRILSFGSIIGVCTTSILLIVLSVFAKQLCMLFGLSGTEALSIGTIAVRLYCLSALFECFASIAECYYQSTDRENATYIISIARNLVFSLFFVLIFSKTDIYTFWLCYPAAQFCALIVIQFIRMNKKFSAKDLVTEDRLYTVSFDEKMENLSTTLSELDDLCASFGISSKQKMYIMNSLEEVCVAIRDNVASHELSSLYIIATVVFETNGQVRFCIRDNATAYNPFEIGNEKISSENSDDADVLAGIGIMMVKRKAKEFNYRRYLNFNTMIVIV